LIYVRNDPVNLVDPDGRSIFSFLGGIFGAIGRYFSPEDEGSYLGNGFLGTGWWGLDGGTVMVAAQTQPGIAAALAQAAKLYPPEFVGPSQNPNFVYVGDMSKSGPNQDKIRDVANWIIGNVDQDCSHWLLMSSYV
jgi:hypothetical protein